jgi:hypothetical protein
LTGEKVVRFPKVKPSFYDKENHMAKPAIADEVQVLRFFETGPIQKVETVFNIVTEKMRERLQGRAHESEGSRRQSGSARKYHARPNPEAPAAEPSGQTT